MVQKKPKTSKASKILVLNLRDIMNPRAGGLEVRLHELSKRLARDGYEVTWLCSRFPGCADEEKADGIRILRRGSESSCIIAAFLYYYKNLRNEGFALIIEDVDKMPFFTPFYARGNILVNCSQMNSKVYKEEFSIPISWLGAILEKIVIPVVYRNRPFITDAESTRACLKRNGLRGEIKIVSDGINLPLFTKIPFEKKKRDQIVVVSRLKRYKGIHHIIRAMSLVLDEIPTAKLVIVGRGDYEKELKQLSSRLGLLNKSVFFRGYISENEKIKLLKESAILVNHSIQEGFGINIIEANACGTPAIASDVDGLRDTIIDGKTGLLVQHGDEFALAKSIIRLLKDGELRRKMEARAYIHAKRFSWDASYRRFRIIIRQFIK
ncbi:MAG: glycosyltransferase family 4 protein [archaeon]